MALATVKVCKEEKNPEPQLINPFSLGRKTQSCKSGTGSFCVVVLQCFHCDTHKTWLIMGANYWFLFLACYIHNGMLWGRSTLGCTFACAPPQP